MKKHYTWWGYVHVNGHIQAKPYSGDWRDIEDAQESPFARIVIKPFEFDTEGDPRAYAVKFIELNVKAVTGA